MAGNLLLNQLSDGKLENIGIGVKDYLSPLLTQDLTDSDRYKYGLFAVKFLHGCVKCLTNETTDSLMSAIHTAYKSYQQTKGLVQLSEPLLVLKVLYHILTKLPQKEIIDDVMSIATYILYEVGDKSVVDGAVSNMLTGVCHTLWNQAIKLEASVDSKIAKASLAESALKLRHMALKFMILRKNDLSVIVEKTLITFARFEHVLLTSSGKKGDDCGKKQKWVLPSGVCDDIYSLLTDSYDHDSSLAKNLVLIRVQQFKYLWSQNLTTEARNTMEILQQCSWWKDHSTLDIRLPVLLCKACLLLHSVKANLEEVKNISSTKSKGEPNFQGLAELLDECSCLQQNDITTDKKQSEDLFIAFVLASSSLIGEAKFLLSSRVCCPPSQSVLGLLRAVMSVLSVQSSRHREHPCGDLSSIQRMWTWNVQPKKTLSSCYLLQLQYLHTICKTQTGDSVDDLTAATDLIQSFETIFTQTLKGKPDKSLLHDQHCLGSMAQKFGSLCYNMGRYETALQFYKTACCHHTEWCRADPEKLQQKCQEVGLWKYYDCLADCYRQTGEYELAMDTVIDCLLIDNSHLLSAAKLWGRVKKDQLKKDVLSQDMLILTLLDGMAKKDVNLPIVEKTAILKSELQIYRTYRSMPRMHEAEYTVLKQLLALTKDAVDQASLLLEEVKLLWLNPSLSPHRCILTLAEHAMKLLTKAGAKHKPSYFTTSAEAHLWLYIVRKDQLCKQVHTADSLDVNSQPYEESENQDTEDKPALKITKIKSPSITITMETKMTNLLDKAVELWDCFLGDNKKCDDVKILPIIQSIQLCAAIYCSAGKPLKALQTLQVAQKPSAAKMDSSWLSTIQLRLSKVLLELGLLSVGETMLENTDGHSDLSHMLMRAEIALMLGDVTSCADEASSLLQKTQSIQPRTRDSCMLEGCAQRLLSHVMRVGQPQCEERLGITANSTHLAQESVRCHTSVVHHLLGKQLDESLGSKGSTAIERWLSVTELLTSLLHLGRTHILIGYARGATCYLEEGLRVAHALNLPRWCAGFLTELARLSLLAGNKEDTAVYLDQARDILMSKSDQTVPPDAASQSSLSNVTINEGGNSRNTSSGDINTSSKTCFGFASPALTESQDEDQQEDFVLHSVPLTMRDRGMSEDSESGQWSPFFPVSTEPEMLCHGDDCRCGFCADLTSHRLYAGYLSTLSEHYLFNSNPDKALDTLNHSERFLNSIAVRIPNIIKSNSADVAPAKNRTNQKEVSLTSLESNSGRFRGTETLPMWVRLAQGKVQALLCEAHYQKGQCSRALAAVKTGQEFISDIITAAPELSHLRAQLHICHAQVLLTVICPQRGNLLSVQPATPCPFKVSRPGSSPEASLNKTPLTDKRHKSGRTKDKVNDLRMNLGKLMIADRVANNTTEKETVVEKSGSPVGTRTVRTTEKEMVNSGTDGAGKLLKGKKTRGNKKSCKAEKTACIPESDLDDEVGVLPSTTGGSRKSIKKSIKKSPKSEIMETAEGSEEGTPVVVPVTEDICTRLGQLSITKTEANTASMCDSKCDVPPLLNTEMDKKDNRRRGRVYGMKTEIKGADSVSKVPPKLKLLPQLENCHDELDVKSEKIIKSYSKKSSRSAIPVKVSPSPETVNMRESVFDFNQIDDSKCGKVKASKTQGRKKPTNNLPVRTTRRTRKNQGVEIETGRFVDSPPEKVSIFSNLNISALPSGCSPDIPTLDPDFSSLNTSWPDNVTDLTLGDCDVSVSGETCPPVQELSFGKCFLPLSISPNLSIEMIRAGSDEDGTPLCPRNTRRKPGRKKTIVKEIAEERELPRASRVTEFCDNLRNPRCKLKQRRSRSAETELKMENTQTDSDIPASDVTEVKRHLDTALRKISEFPPLVLYRDVCHFMALQCLKTSSMMSAYFLSEAMAITLRHRALSNTAKKEKLSSKGKAGVMPPESGQNNINHVHLQFNQAQNIIPSLLDILPQEWTVCMVSVVKTGHNLTELFVTRLEKHGDPVVKQMDGFSSCQAQTIVSEFNDIIEASRQSMKVTDKTEWWKTRQQIDEALQELLKRLEDSWLRGWKGLLLGQLAQPDHQDRQTELVDGILESCDQSLHSKQATRQLWQLVISSAHSLSEDQLTDVITDMTGLQAGRTPHANLKSLIRQKSELLQAKESTRHPVILILDQPIQHLPWESIPVLRGQPVCRLSSLHHLYTQLLLEKGRGQSAIREGIDPQSTYYMLNPDSNLPATQERFAPIFAKQEGWTGITSVPPTKDQFTSALTDYQLLVYCGHGAGSKYLHGDDLQFVQCRAVTILMGCSSGRLRAHGQLEPIGMMHNYFLAGCPCVVANLWDVTDRDIDRLTENLLNTWLTDSSEKSLASVLAKSRNSCRLSYLIGAAPVVYGLPVHLQ